MTFAPDGSPIDLYLRLPSFGEAERIHSVMPSFAPARGTSRTTASCSSSGTRLRPLDDEELDQELVSAGLRPSRVLGERRTWVEARLYSAP
jgi:hypothetical protein